MKIIPSDEQFENLKKSVEEGITGKALVNACPFLDTSDLDMSGREISSQMVIAIADALRNTSIVRWNISGQGTKMSAQAIETVLALAEQSANLIFLPDINHVSLELESFMQNDSIASKQGAMADCCRIKRDKIYRLAMKLANNAGFEPPPPGENSYYDTLMRNIKPSFLKRMVSGRKGNEAPVFSEADLENMNKKKPAITLLLVEYRGLSEQDIEKVFDKAEKQANSFVNVISPGGSARQH